jgi:zinc protease
MKHPLQTHLDVISHAFCCRWVLAASPRSAQVAPVKAEQFTLANGLTLIIKPDRRAPTAVHMLWVRVGSMDEVDGTSGVAHVLEHMMFKGTPDWRGRVFAPRGGPGRARKRLHRARLHRLLPADSGQPLADVMKLEADRFAATSGPTRNSARSWRWSRKSGACAPKTTRAR